MRVLILAPLYIPELIQLTHDLAEQGHEGWVVGGTSVDELPDLVQRSLTAYLSVPSLADEDDLFARVAAWLGRRVPDRVVSNRESLQLVAARLRGYYCLPAERLVAGGLEPDAHPATAQFATTGARARRPMRVRTELEIRAVAQAFGFPLVLTTTVAAGSPGTFHCRDAAELDAALDATRHLLAACGETGAESAAFAVDALGVDATVVCENASRVRPESLALVLERASHDAPPIVGLAARGTRFPVATDGRAPVDLGAIPAVDLGEVAAPSIPAAVVAAVESYSARYVDLGPIGQGGMGEVRRVRDRELNRILAMKIIHPAWMESPAMLARFLEEAQATAQLQHPNIVPVHDIGRAPDGRVWFVMKEVRGQTLAAAIREVHDVSTTRWETSASGWNLRRLVTAFHTVCHAVAYAHERGVIHRDLKPDNVMLGRLGEVHVIDWGLAKIVGRRDLVAEATDIDVVQTERVGDHATRMGQVAGTPAYMPPEQAQGRIDRIDARSDVYALGATLYEVLAGRAPYVGSTMETLAQVAIRPPKSLDTCPLPLPSDLTAACTRAMARDPQNRYPTAMDLANAIEDWLDGVRRREQALQVVADAAANAPEVARLRAEAAVLQEQAATRLATLEPWRPEEDKAEGWALQDAAAGLLHQAELHEMAQEHMLRSALTHVPDLPQAHAALAARYREAHVAAETEREDPSRAEAWLRRHATALPEGHPERAAHFAYLRGDGALTLHTDPPGASVELFRYELERRRLVPVHVRSLGRTPLDAVPLSMGSYLCVLRHPDRETVQYPVRIRRGEHWNGVPPGAHDPLPVYLPQVGDLSRVERYVPAGWFASGGDPGAIASLPCLGRTG